MNIITIISEDFQENTYLCQQDEDVVVIDPGSDAAVIQSKIKNQKSIIRYVLLTHGHYDHILGALELNAPIYAHEAEKNLLENEKINLSSYSGLGNINLNKVNYLKGESGKLDEFEYIHTPGHTAGCMIIKAGNILFTGDTLFLDTVGRTDTPTGDSKQLQKSLKVFDSLDKNLMCYPGHGGSFTLAEAYAVNYFLK